jgi:hypothetical protein
MVSTDPLDAQRLTVDRRLVDRPVEPLLAACVIADLQSDGRGSEDACERLRADLGPVHVEPQHRAVPRTGDVVPASEGRRDACREVVPLAPAHREAVVALLVDPEEEAAAVVPVPLADDAAIRLGQGDVNPCFEREAGRKGGAVDVRHGDGP